MKIAFSAWATRPRGRPVNRTQQMAKNRGSVMTITELSVYLKVSRSTLYKLAQAGRVPGQKVGKHWRFHREAVDAWLKKQPTKR